MEKLTLVILTYNRKEKLLRQLHSIYSQKESRDVRIEIIDNHSNYDVQKSVQEEFGSELTRNLHISINPVNIGMCANLAMPFLHCKTDWLWTLSDDDETLPGSIRMILNNIEEYPDTAMFKYETEEAVSRYKNTIIQSLPELITFCEKNKIGGGWLVFLSNNVYNTKKALEHYHLTLSNCYSAIAHMLPMFFILDSKAGNIRMMERCPIHFNIPEAGKSGYPYLHTAVGVSSIAGYNFNLNFRDIKKIAFLVTCGFTHYRLCLCALEMKDRKQGRFLYETVYRNAFKSSGYFIDKLYNCLFYFCYLTHIKIGLNTAIKIRSKLQKVYPRIR